jgi:hypothetical protein
MPTYDYPYIRDTLVIDADRVQKFCDRYTGSTPIFLIGRIVKHAPGYTLRVGQKRLVALT